MQKLAEMDAMSRHDEICPEVPGEWSAAFILLLVKNPPSEDDVEAHERGTLALRRRIGKAKWCQLYSVEMQEAYFIFQMLMQRNRRRRKQRARIVHYGTFSDTDWEMMFS